MRQQSPDFRKNETKYIFDCWARSRSVSLIGVGSVGKSNFLQHIASKDTVKDYSPTGQPTMLPLVLDANLLGSLQSDEMFQCWAGFELIVHRLYLAAYPFDMLDNDAMLFFETYTRMQDGSNPNFAYMGLRYFELAMQFFFRRNIKIVLVFDEFELFFKYLPLRFFLNLRGLRDTQKNLLSFMTFTREPLPRLLERYDLSALDYEPFVELFNDHVFYLGPYEQTDALAMAKSIAPALSQENLREILVITGGFAGLIRATTKAITTMTAPYRLDQLVQDRAIQEECRTILAAIDEDERLILEVAQGKRSYDDQAQRAAVNLLVQKRLLSLDSSTQQITIQPPILRAYLERN